jgi:tryptophan synthase alpha subunit
VIELGMPFTDPMADGPALQASSLRALRTGMNAQEDVKLVTEFRAGDNETPIIPHGLLLTPDLLLRRARRSSKDARLPVSMA